MDAIFVLKAYCRKAGAANHQGREVTMSNTSKRGFASMDPEKQREIASRGGRAAHAKGTAHRFTPEEARVAGRKGGEASRGGRGRSEISQSESSSRTGDYSSSGSSGLMQPPENIERPRSSEELGRDRGAARRFDEGSVERESRYEDSDDRESF